MLNSIGPKIDKQSHNVALSNTKACNFAITVLCGKQSNALGRSRSNSGYSLP